MALISTVSTRRRPKPLIRYFCYCMNILLLTYQGDIAGSTNSIYYLATGLAAKGHTVVVGARQQSLLYQMLKQTRVIRVPMTFGGKFDVVNMRQIRDAVQKYQIQIINAQSSIDRYTAVFARWLYQLPVKVVHTRRQEPKSMGGMLQTLFYVKGTDKIVVISPQLKQTFIKKGYPEAHLQVIMNGIPPERFTNLQPNKTEALRQQFGLQPGEVVIGCVARRKKQEQLLQALALLNQPNITLLFAGIEPGSLNHIAQQLHLKNRLIYAGIVPADEIMNYYPLFTLCVLPSTMEGFGLTLTEAMGMGVPVIGTRSQGIIDVLDNEKNGLWFDDGNIEELAGKIQQILTDETTRNRLIENGKMAALSTFSINRTIDEYEHFFAALLQN